MAYPVKLNASFTHLRLPSAKNSSIDIKAFLEHFIQGES